jgi:hypothetical protein
MDLIPLSIAPPFRCLLNQEIKIFVDLRTGRVISRGILACHGDSDPLLFGFVYLLGRPGVNARATRKRKAG